MPYKKKEILEQVSVESKRENLRKIVNDIRKEIDYRLQEAYKDMAVKYGYSEEDIEKIHKKYIYRFL